MAGASIGLFDLGELLIRESRLVIPFGVVQ